MESAAHGLKTYSRRRKRVTNIPSAYTTLMTEGNNSREEAEQRNMMNTWVWEYVLMKCKDFKLAELLIKQIPVADSPYAKKMLNFKMLYFGGAKEESMNMDLGALEGMEVLYREEWKGKVPDNKRELFDMVQRLQILIRAEFAVKHLRVDDRDGYLSALEKHWNETIHDTEDAAVDESSIEGFRKQVKEDLTAVVKRPNMRSFILDEYKRERLEEGMQRFLELAMDDLGHSFLERAAEDVLQGRYVPGSELAAAAAAAGGGGGGGETNKRRNKRRKTRARPPAAEDDLAKTRMKLKDVKDPLDVMSCVAEELLNEINERQSFALALQLSNDVKDVEEPPKDTQLPKLSLLRKQRKKRDTRNRWTPDEENALRAGVEEYGKGCWKRILMANSDIFSHRNEVDLKDKWRNIEMKGARARARDTARANNANM